jgi:hypothetical protein
LENGNPQLKVPNGHDDGWNYAAQLNDDGVPFARIADAIEDKYLKAKKKIRKKRKVGDR